MSGRLASTTRTKYPPARTVSGAAFAVLCGLVIGLPATNVATAQTKNPNASQPDNQAPVPADGAKVRSPEDFAIPNGNAAMFDAIKDFEPVASEEKNSLEYQAWCAFVTHVHSKKFTAAELEQQGARDVTAIELLKPIRTDFRRQLLRFEGKLVCIRKLKAPKYFRDNPESTIRELYEARFVPLDESPLNPVSVIFLELPKEFAEVAKQPFKDDGNGNAGGWVDFDSWVRVAGYYFKPMSVPGDEGKTISLPILVGKSITPLPGRPVPSGDDPTVIEYMRIFNGIRDDTKMIRPDSWEEVASQNRVLMHSNRFTAEELEKHARTGVEFADLFEPVRVDFKLKLVKFEGRLIALKKIDTNPELKAAGINQVYEGWMVPAREPNGNPICVLFTEPLEGVEPPERPGERVNKWVSFAGYSFKLMRYESAERDDKGTYKVKRAPLLIGRKPIGRLDPDGPSTLSWNAFLQVAVGVAGLLVLAAGGLAWWYRSGDRKAKQEIDAARRNPFDPNSAPTSSNN